MGGPLYIRQDRTSASTKNSQMYAKRKIVVQCVGGISILVILVYNEKKVGKC